MKLFTQICVIALLSLIINACEKVENDFDILKIEKYRMQSMLYPTPVMPDTNNVELVYNNKNQIIQRIGNLITINQATGYSYRFYQYIADTVMYYNDSIIIKKQLISNEDITGFSYPFKRKLFLQNGLIMKEINNVDYYDYGIDTIVYQYNGQNQIIQTVTDSKYYKRKYSKYKYDEDENLILITSEIYDDYNEDILLNSIDTTWFLDYDNSPNLTKNLFIFQECYYRSLSTNNFRKYIYKKYDASDSSLSLTEERNWEFDYSESNYPIY